VFVVLFVMDVEPTTPHVYQQEHSAKVDRFDRDDKLVLMTSSSIKRLNMVALSVQRCWKTQIQPTGLLAAEEYCCDLLDWCCAICDVSEGFALMLADILTSKISLELCRLPVSTGASHIKVCTSTQFPSLCLLALGRNGLRLSL